MSVAVAAVDFGATSIRVCRVVFGDGPPSVDVVHRHPHAAISDGVHLRWDWPRLVAEMERGLAKARETGPIASIGVDTWGVDYGLLDHRGELVEPPISYRDHRTDGYRNTLDAIGERRFFALTGLQALQLNTLFQLAAHDRATRARGCHVVLLPELLVHHLTGTITAEYTSAGTTGLLDVRTRTWSPEIADAIALPLTRLPELQSAGTPVGAWRGVPVHLVGGHDTASAVVAGATASEPFVSSGTWLLVGREQTVPDTSRTAFAAGLSNEQGALGGIRLLRNVAGWWLVEECRRAWGDTDLDALLAAAAAVGEVPMVDATDPSLLAPKDMEEALCGLAGVPRPASRAVVTRIAVASMAASAANVLASMPPVPHAPASTSVRVFGGGAGSPLLLELLRRQTGLDATVGPVEASALGNAMVQAIALGVVTSLADARATLVDEERVG